jgi:sugar fermentation stimulation protein A
VNYEKIRAGFFVSRPNRFAAEVTLDGQIERVHVKNTGRCRELLVPGANVYLNETIKPKRVTRYDLVAVRKGERLINMDAQAPNAAFLEYLRSGQYISGATLIKPEARYGTSRFDFYVEAGHRRIFIEVKGVTLENAGVVLFPDAPTERGVKHLKALSQCVRDGYEARVVFVAQMSNVLYFVPNDETHPAFGETLAAAKAGGVAVDAFDCAVTPDSMRIGKPVEVRPGI